MFVEYFKNLAKNYRFESLKIKQNDSLLNPNIRATGCYFRSLIGIAETLYQRYMTAKQINELYTRCVPNIMLANCYVNDPAEIIKMAAIELGYSCKCFQRGLYQGNEFIFWNNIYRNYTDTIIQWKTSIGSHFTQADENMNEVYDPWNGKIKKMYKQRIILYEVIKC